MSNATGSRRQLLKSAVGISVTLALVGYMATAAETALAQDSTPYPDRPLHFIVPFTPGGGPDVLARIVAQQITSSTGKIVVVDNRPGANGAIAAQAVAGSPADGYTVLIADTGHLAINPALYKKLPYDPVADFAPVSLATWTPFFLVVNPALPVKTLSELLEYAKQNPSKLSYGSSGNGSPHHLTMELFKSMAHVQIAHIPYKGVAESVPALLGDQIDMMFVALPSVGTAVEAGKLRVLAVSSSERSSLMPSVPTVSEAGVPGFDMVSRIGFLMPVRTPSERVAWLNSQIIKALSNPDIAKKMPAMGMEIIGSTPQDYARAISADLPKFRKIVAATGIRVD
jgi:tripartite-type tricarboxylate transporter receptor subunit TctC